MLITIVGLGLMGGSLAYAIKGFENSVIYGVDINRESCRLALSKGAVDKAFEDTALAVKEADLTIFCTYPAYILEAFDTLKNAFKKGSIVTEICGVKQHISEKAEAVLSKNIDYAGIHPMAGKEVWGFENADPGIFKDSGMIITPIKRTKQSTVDLLKRISTYIGVKRLAVANADEHDRLIAFTSDLMHISASALCMEIPKNFEKAFTAGAFRDCTRVAHLDPLLWTELFLQNREMTAFAIDKYIESLNIIKEAIEKNNQEELRNILIKTSKNKWEMQNEKA